MPSLTAEDIILSNESIILARPWRLVNDPFSSLLREMQKTLRELVSDEYLEHEEKCLLNLLTHGVDPSETERNLPMFYSKDRQIVFIFAVSITRTILDFTYLDVDWTEKISNTFLKGEYDRQVNFYEKKSKNCKNAKNKAKSDFSHRKNLMQFIILVGNAAISHIDYPFRFDTLIR